jgi:predicted alpha/beta-hydrolase family hydrolase
VKWTIEGEIAQIPVSCDNEVRNCVAVLAHGAGSHMQHQTLLWLGELVGRTGCSVVRFNFAYRALGKAMPDRMPALMDTYRAVIASVRERLTTKHLIIGGHSMGGRVASMIASEGDDIGGLLLFGYPLHPPGKFEKMRDAHLSAITCPVLQISGTRDEFCRRDLMEAVTVGDNYRIVWIEGADHSYSISRASGNTKTHAESQIVEAVSDWFEGI